MKDSKEQAMRERAAAAAAAAAALDKQCLAEDEMKSQQVLMPVASEDVYANIHNMADKMLTPTPISQHQTTISSNSTVSTDTNTNMSQFDVTQFEREDDPFENVERQVINEFEELNQVFQKSAESSESSEGNYENVVVVNKPPPDAAAPPPLPPPPLPPPPGSAAAAAAAAASASAEHESPRHVPLGSQAAPIENSTAAAEPETTLVEDSGNGPDENSEAEFDDENAIYGNLPCRKKSTTGSPKRKDSNNYVMVSYVNGRLVRDASKRQAIAAARQSSLDEELKSKIVMSNLLNQKTCTVPASVVSGNSEESMGLSPDATILSEGIYENMPVSSPDKNNYENCFLAQRSRHSVAFDGDSPVCPPAIPPRTDLAKLRGTHSTPNIHQASSGKDAKSVSPFKSPPSPMPRKQVSCGCISKVLFKSFSSVETVSLSFLFLCIKL